jgi:Ni,Fe-hydrogenase I large subunit
MRLGVAKAKEALENIETIKEQVREFQNVIEQAIDSNNVSFVNMGMWRASRDRIQHNDSLSIWKDVLERVKEEME